LVVLLIENLGVNLTMVDRGRDKIGRIVKITPRKTCRCSGIYASNSRNLKKVITRLTGSIEIVWWRMDGQGPPVIIPHPK
jgi:hypothetical protein